MSQSLADILNGRTPSEPPEIRIIKNYVQDKFKSPATVTIQPRQIVITVRGAALAGSLRLQLHELKKLCQTDKRLHIRIG